MTLIAIVFLALAVGFLATAFLLAVALCSPVVVLIDSGSWQLRVRWFPAFEYRRPLPGGRGETGLSWAGRPVAFRTRKAKRLRPPRAPRKRRAKLSRFFRRCLGSPPIRRALIKRFAELWSGIRRSVCLTRRQIAVSLPDPAWNGMLAGWMAQCGEPWGSAMDVNFLGENAVFLEARVYPCRVAQVLLRFLVGLPFRALFREWRASSAIASG